MSEKNNHYLIDECKRIGDDCKWTAEAHHTIAHKKERIGFWVKIIPAILASGSGAAVLLGVDICVAWLAVISGAVFAYSSIANPDTEANKHTKAAKEFTVLKHDARSLHESFYQEMGQTEFYTAVRVLRERYNCIVRNMNFPRKSGHGVKPQAISSRIHAAFYSRVPSDVFFGCRKFRCNKTGCG